MMKLPCPDRTTSRFLIIRAGENKQRHSCIPLLSNTWFYWNGIITFLMKHQAASSLLRVSLLLKFC